MKVNMSLFHYPLLIDTYVKYNFYGVASNNIRRYIVEHEHSIKLLFKLIIYYRVNDNAKIDSWVKTNDNKFL